MFDRVRTDQLDRSMRRGYQAKRWNRRLPHYGYRFAVAGAAVLAVVGLFAIV